MEEDLQAYLPFRVLGGAIQSEGLEIALRERKTFVPWERIRLLCLGIIREPGLEFHPGVYMKTKKALSKMFADKITSEDKESQAKIARETLYLEIFVLGEAAPFRVDPSQLNYRHFLKEEINYSSEKNFGKFLTQLSEHLGHCQFDVSLTAYLNDRKENVMIFENVYEFQRSCKEKWRQCQALNP